jgi:putative transposase
MLAPIWCIMPSHTYTITGSKKEKLEDIIRDMKKYNSVTLKTTINNNNLESRKEWMMWMMQRAGKKNGNNKDYFSRCRCSILHSQAHTN